MKINERRFRELSKQILEKQIPERYPGGDKRKKHKDVQRSLPEMRSKG